MTDTYKPSDEPFAMDLSGQFLIAMPGQVGDVFAGAVVYVCEHNAEGALGLVINRTMDLTVGDLLKRLELDLSLEIGPVKDAPVFFGGPVQTDRGFVLHTTSKNYSSSIDLGAKQLTTSRDVLEAVSQGEGPDPLMVYLGYAGWGPDQLEEEISRNAWLHVAASDDMIFNVPVQKRYETALAQLGISPATLMGGAGHA